MICGLHVGIEASGDGGRHVEGLADVRAPAANEGATSRDRRQPCEVCGLRRPGCSQDYKATGKDGVSLDDEDDRGFDGLDLSFDLIETL